MRLRTCPPGRLHQVADDAGPARRDDVSMATDTHEHRDELLADTPDELHDQAVRSLKKRADLKAHAVVYVLFNAVVWGVWLVIAASSHSWWPWPLFLTLLWGIGLLMNAWDVYMRTPFSEQDVRREMDRLSHRG